ncbi:aldose 1-epimerase family protein [Xylocopilactobacillus apis]|uniref:Galactose mutarotase n=1 Tax=Xylocopilactobacillus apis TaxID=2932183 RepID=A0AAU9CTA1_9LACO|nr:aldose 1-epimerase family protein [Xylocopilactobacillus apis]BDR55581.1 galactose mutarotase [Xylocopilactobacillus apis]
MITIENKNFRVKISELGAEVQSVQNKSADNYEYIWTDKNKEYWQRHFPILFPAIGRSNDNKYKLKDQVYPMMQHGFARDNTWDVLDKQDSEVTLVLNENESSLKIYPFKFTLSVTYKLNDYGLLVQSNVTNNDEKEMPFALGFHPAFNVVERDDGSFDDYEMTVDPLNGNLRKFGTGPVPFRNGKIEDLKGVKGNLIPLTHELLDDGLVLIDNTEIKKAEMKSSNHPRSVTVDLGNFPYMNLWSPEHQKAPFICIEPFAGLPDIASNDPIDWYQKDGNTILKSNESKELYFQIDFK